MQNKNRVLSVIAGLAGLLIASNVLAATNGAYIGGQLGWGDIHQSDSNGNVNDTGLAGLATLGYQFNPYFALQTDVTKFSQTTDNAQEPGLINAKATIDTYAIDAVMKGIVPLPNNFNLFGTLGVAYLNEQLSASAAGTPTYNDTEAKVLPTFGAGVSYDINQNLSTELAWTHIQKIGSSQLANTDFVGLGLTYHFG